MDIAGRSGQNGRSGRNAETPPSSGIGNIFRDGVGYGDRGGLGEYHQGVERGTCLADSRIGDDRPVDAVLLIDFPLDRNIHKGAIWNTNGIIWNTNGIIWNTNGIIWNTNGIIWNTNGIIWNTIGQGWHDWQLDPHMVYDRGVLDFRLLEPDRGDT